MILGASHLTLASADIDADLRELAEIGYAKRFVERGMPSHPAKAPFLSRPFTSHDIAYATTAGGLAIELVRYGPALHEFLGSLVPIFRGAPPSGFDGSGTTQSLSRVVADALKAGNVAVGDLPPFGTPACFVGSGVPQARLAGIAVAVENLAAASGFWEGGLGYHRCGEGDGWRHLTFRSPVEAWRLELILWQQPAVSHAATLDSRGAACLSMVCTDLQKDRESILVSGTAMASTGPFEIAVEGRPLNMELFCGPDHVFVELFQVAAARTTSLHP